MEAARNNVVSITLCRVYLVLTLLIKLTTSKKRSCPHYTGWTFFPHLARIGNCGSAGNQTRNLMFSIQEGET